jgi:polo-like kinase 1
MYFYREIASRNPHSFATDVWSLGILIVTLLIGRPPFDTDSMYSRFLIDKIRSYVHFSSCSWNIK